MASLATRSRPFRYATVKPIKNDFYNLKSIAAPSASSHSIAASALWIALPWNKGGVLPVPIDRSLWKAINDPPGISAHSGELTDLAFSPFNDYLLATAGSEGIVKIWELPKDCYNLPSAISSSTIKIEGGLESVSTIKWHPSAEGIIAVGYKNGINIYNVSSQETASSPLYSFKIEGFGRDIVSIAWSYDGSLIAIITKNGLVTVFDPRSAPSNILSTAYAPPSMKKPQHALFVSEGAGERLVLSGLTASHRPLVQFYDVRPSIPTSSTTPVFTQDLDFSQGYSLPLYDRDTGMLFFTIRGSNVVAVFDIEPEKVAVGPPKQIMVPCHSASCDDVFKGACLISKRAVNSNAAEIQRLVLLGAEAIQPYSISVPRKVGGFHEELYPATSDIVAALTADQWKAGENKDPVKISMAIINARGPSPSSSSGGNSSASAPSSSPTASSSASASFEKKEDKPIAAKFDGGRVSPAPVAAAAPVYAASAARKNLEAKLKKSPFTHTSMKEPQYKQYTFFDIKIGQTIALAENLQCNEKYFAFPWKTLAGSAIAVFPVNQVGRAETSTPAIRGHSTAATAFDLSIQDPSLIGTGSADGQVRIWRLPEEGVKKDLLDGQEESKFIVAGKVQLIKFHPFIPDLLITAAAAPETGKHTIEIWDLRIKNPSSPRLSYSNIHSDFIIDISFHPHGHRIATASKDGRIRVIDLGTGNVISQFTAVESIRDTRAVFTAPNRIVTTGFGSGSIRSISVWDVSGSEGKKLAQREIDRNSNTPVPRYDEDTGLLYVGNGGGSFLHLFEIKNEEPFVELLNVFESPNEAMGFSLMPKKKCDVKTVEVAKGFKLGKDAVFPLTFTLARKRLEFFQDDVYPDSRDLSTPILSIDDLLSGNTPDGNASYKKLSLQPSGMKKLSEAPPEEMTESQKKYQEAMKLRNAPKAKGVLGHTSAEEVKEHFRGVAANYSGRNRFDAVQDKAADVDEDEWA